MSKPAPAAKQVRFMSPVTSETNVENRGRGDEPVQKGKRPEESRQTGVNELHQSAKRQKLTNVLDDLIEDGEDLDKLISGLDNLENIIQETNDGMRPVMLELIETMEEATRMGCQYNALLETAASTFATDLEIASGTSSTVDTNTALMSVYSMNCLSNLLDKMLTSLDDPVKLLQLSDKIDECVQRMDDGPITVNAARINTCPQPKALSRPSQATNRHHSMTPP